MIESDNKRAFNSRATVITSDSFWCMVSTAKEGIFSGLSTCFLVTESPGIPPRACAKIIYSSALNSQDRHNIHGAIASTIDKCGEDGASISDILDVIFADLKNRGIATEAVNGL